MADIYLVRDEAENLFVLRALRPELRFFHWNAARRFCWGCEALAQFNHENIVRLHATGKYKGRHYAILEYVPGSNLKELILRNDPILTTQRRQLLAGMATGLAHIHERGFLHLDFKPENILVTSDGIPKIIDFDLSIPRPTRPRRASSLSGTFAYLAPEQILKQPVDERADIFAYGVTAYEMLTGKKPVAAASRSELLQRYTRFNEHLRPLRFHNPDIPVSIEHVILKCLEKEPSRRYPAISLVVRDLQT